MVIWALQCLSPESAWYRSVVSRVFIDRQRGTTVAPLHHIAPHHPLPLRPKQTTVLLTTLAWPPKIRLLYLLSSSQLLNCTRNWHQTWNIQMQCAAFNAAHSVPECGFEGLKCQQASGHIWDLPRSWKLLFLIFKIIHRCTFGLSHQIKGPTSVKLAKTGFYRKIVNLPLQDL